MSVNFIIVGAARTGSTLLVRTLNSLESVVCHGEILNPENVRGYEDGFALEQASKEERDARLRRLAERRDADCLGFIEEALSGPHLAIGFKALYSALLAPRWQDTTAALLAREDLRFIHLRRRNGLRRFVSEVIMRAGGPIHSGAGGRGDRKLQVEIDIEAFKHADAEVAAQGAQVDALLSGRQVLPLLYEDLAADTGNAVAQVLDFLGVPAPAAPVEARLNKVGAQDLREVVENFSALLDDAATRELALSD